MYKPKILLLALLLAILLAVVTVTPALAGYHAYEVMARVIPEIQKRGHEVTSLSRVPGGTPFVLKSTAASTGAR